MKKIGVFAGTFDPIHDGHIAFALEAAKQLDKVFLLVEPRPRRKQGVKALEHRFEMVRLATKEHPKLGAIKLNQARFTPKETMPLLAARFKGAQISFLFGDDVVNHMVDNIADWPDVEYMFDNTTILIGTRHHKKAELSDRIDMLQDYGLALRRRFIEINWPDTSSQAIRQQLRKSKHPKDIHKDVLRYIQDNNLYLPFDEDGRTFKR